MAEGSEPQQVSAVRVAERREPRAATATACANIALVKYWGKRDVALNLPATGSLSITLAALRTRTTVRFAAAPGPDTFLLNGQPASPEAARRVTAFLDLVRPADRPRAEIESVNDFPTGAGLASSASGYAALALAASRAAGRALDPAALSVLARRGSGSAARSVFGGFVLQHRGERPDGSDAVAEPLHGPEHWPLEVVVALASTAEKAVGSREGMSRTAATSPFYAGWLASHPPDLAAARAALAARELPVLGELMEHSALKLHALLLSTRPGLLYFAPATVAVIHEVWARRRAGLAGYLTIDAGPQVKVLTTPDLAPAWAECLAAVPGVVGILRSPLGPGATLETSPP